MTNEELLGNIQGYLSDYFRGGDVRIRDVILPGQIFDHSRVRVSFNYIGISAPGEYFNIETSIDAYMMEYVTGDAVMRVCREITEGINRHRREYMAQWNQRQDQRLRQQEDQRRVARGQQPVEPQAEFPTADDPWGGTAAVNSIYNEYLRARDVHLNRFQTTPLTTSASPNWYSISTNSTQAQFQEPVRTHSFTEDQLKAMLKSMLKDNLDLRISMTESDGEVSVEAEIFLDGELLISDSDSIQL